MFKFKKKKFNFNIKNFIKKNQLIFYIGILLLVCFLYSLSAGWYVEFKPINGTFQNYNPVRRLLSGNIPYKDFVDYLGMGHLFFGTFFTFIFGGDYQASLVAFTFVSMLSTVLLSYAISYSIFKNKKESILITSLLIMLLIVKPLFFQYFLSIDSQFLRAISNFASPGNSARFIRGMILPIFVLLFTFIYNKSAKIDLEEKRKDILFLVLFSSITALSFIWSNDYGISVWVCSIILYFFIKLKNSKKFFKSALFTLLEIIISFIFVFIYVSILTLGNFPSWLSATFGTGGYQSWYYISSKSYYLFNVDISFYQTLQILISLYYYYLYFQNKDKEKDLKYLALGFANMTAFCAINEYKLLSGGSSYEYGTTILFFTLIYEFIEFIKNDILKRKYVFGKFMLAVLFIIQLSFFASHGQNELLYRVGNKSGVYIEELGGYNYTFGNDLIKTKKFIGDKKVFSTYSSAIEAMTDQFQPTKYDYIIHALGDNAREEYLNEFRKGNFDYVSTIQRFYTDWELGWVMRANWYFYRELYSEYHPVYGNSYQLFWEKNGESSYVSNKNVNIKVDYRRINENMVEVNVETDKNINGYADVYLDYKVDKIDRFISKFIFNKMLHIANSANIESCGNESLDYNYLKDESKEYVPVKIINGKGSIILTSKPEESTKLTIREVDCEKIFTVVYDYIEVDSVEDKEGSIVLKIDKNMTTMSALENAKKILVNGEEVKITNIDLDNFIYLKLKTKMTLDDIKTILITNNNFKIIK